MYIHNEKTEMEKEFIKAVRKEYSDNECLNQEQIDRIFKIANALLK
jgi:hypothetical protein